MSMIVTPWKEFKEGATVYRMQVRYGLDYDFARRNNQSAYFSITASIERKSGTRWVEDSGGMLHDQIAEHFPNLAPLLKWHLTAVDGPLHYIANAKYWWEHYTGTSQFELRSYDPDPKEAFRRTVICEPHEVPPKSTPWPRVKVWLDERLEHLLSEFDDEMDEIGVLENV
jgi:hypothetical protein